ncbi:hypothetical protein, partial [Nocardia rhamnosiphila]|uniref:hypothetical protein n=1 Tax=Nocardia rhamnosiphila TaxID=426716 RepID=UPI001C3FD582
MSTNTGDTSEPGGPIGEGTRRTEDDLRRLEEEHFANRGGSSSTSSPGGEGGPAMPSGPAT